MSNMKFATAAHQEYMAARETVTADMTLVTAVIQDQCAVYCGQM